MHESSGPRSFTRSAVVLSGGAVDAAEVVWPVGFDVASGSANLLVIAADSGAGAAAALGLDIDVLVGDFDSIPGSLLAQVEATAATIERHDCDKDATDLELAIAAAVDRGAARVCVVDSTAGRLDHFLATMLLVASPRWIDVEITAVVDGAHVRVVHPGRRRNIETDPGRTVSLLSIGGASGVTTHGLQWALADAQLPPGTTWGVSNVVSHADAWVEITGGALLAVVPTEEAR